MLEINVRFLRNQKKQRAQISIHSKSKICNGTLSRRFVGSPRTFRTSGKVVATNRGRNTLAKRAREFTFYNSYLHKTICPEALLNCRANVFPVRSSRRYLHSTIAQCDIIARAFPGEAKGKNATPIR